MSAHSIEKLSLSRRHFLSVLAASGASLIRPDLFTRPALAQESADVVGSITSTSLALEALLNVDDIGNWDTLVDGKPWKTKLVSVVDDIGAIVPYRKSVLISDSPLKYEHKQARWGYDPRQDMVIPVSSGAETFILAEMAFSGPVTNLYSGLVVHNNQDRQGPDHRRVMVLPQNQVMGYDYWDSSSQDPTRPKKLYDFPSPDAATRMMVGVCLNSDGTQVDFTLPDNSRTKKYALKRGTTQEPSSFFPTEDRRLGINIAATPEASAQLLRLVVLTSEVPPTVTG